MPILGFSNWVANKDMVSKIWKKWGYSYLIELKTLWEKEKLLVTSNFSFSQNVFKSRPLLMRQNEYLWKSQVWIYSTDNQNEISVKKYTKKKYEKRLWRIQKFLSPLPHNP